MSTSLRTWRVVSVLGQIDLDDAALARVAPEVGSLDPALLYDHILASRVYTLAQRHLERLDGAATTVLARLHNLAAEESARRHAALAPTLDVLRAATQHGARVIKGLALREQYADPELRHEGDVDLQVPDWTTASALAGWLRDEGWQWDTREFPWLKWSDYGALYGQLTLVRDDNEDPYARVDLHIGPFSVGHAGLLAMVGWTTGEVLGVPAFIPNLEQSLALIAAHAMNDGALSMKDVNDVRVLVESGHPDWSTVVELCRGASALPALRDLLRATAAIYPATGLQRLPGRRYLSIGSEETSARARRIARLAWRDERRRGRGPLRAAVMASGAHRYFSAQLAPRLAPDTRTTLRAAERRRDVCWRLFPRETWARWVDSPEVKGTISGPTTKEELGTQLELYRQGTGQVVRLGNDVFIPTVWGDVGASSVALAADVDRST
jgi:hypothetical protein